MDFGWLAGLLGFALAMAATPGPNNAMVAAAAANSGLRRTLPLMAGIAIGVAAITLAVAAVGSPVVANSRLSAALKWTGIVYILWLAWRIAGAEPAAGTPAAKPVPPSFVQGALFQFVNPKLWILVSGSIVTYGHAAIDIGQTTLALVFALILGTATFVSTIAWAAIGAVAGRLLMSRRAERIFNAGMACLLVASLIPVVFG